MPPVKQGVARKTVTAQQRQQKQGKADTLRKRSSERKNRPFDEWSDTWRGVKRCQKPSNGRCDSTTGPCTIYKFVNKDVTLSDGKKGTFKQEWCARTSGQAGTGNKTFDNEKRKLLKKHKSIYNAKEASELTQRQATLIGDLIKVSNGQNASLDEAKKYADRLLKSVKKAPSSGAASKETSNRTPKKAAANAKKDKTAGTKVTKKRGKTSKSPPVTERTERVTQKQRKSLKRTPPNTSLERETADSLLSLAQDNSNGNKRSSGG